MSFPGKSRKKTPCIHPGSSLSPRLTLMSSVEIKLFNLHHGDGGGSHLSIYQKKAKIPRRYNLNGIVVDDGRVVGAVCCASNSSSSITDSQSLSSLFSVSPNIEFRLRKRTLLAGLRCFNVVVRGAGLLTSLIVSSSTNPTSVNIDRRRPSAGCGRTRSMLIYCVSHAVQANNSWSRASRAVLVVRTPERKASKGL